MCAAAAAAFFAESSSVRLGSNGGQAWASLESAGEEDLDCHRTSPPEVVWQEVDQVPK